MQLTFHPLSLRNQQKYKQLLAKCPQITSDYSFANIWGWRDIYGLQWAWQDELVWIRETEPRIRYWGPVGPWESIDWQKILQEHQRSSLEFIRIPEALFKVWKKHIPSKLNLNSDQDHWDYIYSVQELIKLSGNRFHKKKNLLSQFQRKYKSTYINLDPDKIDKALTLQTEWCLWRDCEDSTTLEAENKAILNIFQDWSKLEEITGGGLEVEGHMVAFTVAEPLDEETIVIHFEKACPNYKGLYQAINQMFLANQARDYHYVNREQDLGDPGLRKAKKSYNPLLYLKKYSGVLYL